MSNVVRANRAQLLIYGLKIASTSSSATAAHASKSVNCDFAAGSEGRVNVAARVLCLFLFGFGITTTNNNNSLVWSHYIQSLKVYKIPPYMQLHCVDTIMSIDL